MSHLFGSYLNEDWPDEYAQAMEAVKDFAVSELTTAPLFHDEISVVLAELSSEAELRTLILGTLCSGYDPTEDGATFRDWLTAVAELVDQVLDGD